MGGRLKPRLGGVPPQDPPTRVIPMFQPWERERVTFTTALLRTACTQGHPSLSARERLLIPLLCLIMRLSVVYPQTGGDVNQARSEQCHIFCMRHAEFPYATFPSEHSKRARRNSLDTVSSSVKVQTFRWRWANHVAQHERVV